MHQGVQGLGHQAAHIDAVLAKRGPAFVLRPSIEFLVRGFLVQRHGFHDLQAKVRIVRKEAVFVYI